MPLPGAAATRGAEYEERFQASSQPALLIGLARRIRAANPAVERLTGYAAAELAGRTLDELIAPEWREVAGPQFEGSLTSEGQSRYDTVLLDRAGRRLKVEVSCRPVRRRGAVVGAHAVFRDLEHEQRPEIALRESEERFRGAFEVAAIGMAIVSLEGRYLQVNRSLCRLVGYSAEELLSMKFHDLTHPDDLAANLELLSEAISGEACSYAMEKRYRRKDDTCIWILLSVSLVHGARGEPVYFVTQVQDIDQRKRAELATIELRCQYPRAVLLSSREVQVLGLIAAGQTNEQAGESLGVAVETVSSHVQHAMRKLDAPTRTAAVVTALRLGILQGLWNS